MGITKYKETVSLCPECAREVPSYYEERDDGMYLHFECSEHGRVADKVENDAVFFKRQYEQEYPPDGGHLLLPVTYRCNLQCRFCYALSNSTVKHPDDRPLSTIVEYALRYGDSTNLIGGEPTVREDLFDIITAIKKRDAGRILSVSTNGQKLRDWEYVRELKERGLDFVFLSFNDPSYETSPEVYENKVAALENCLRAGMPLWLQRTVERLDQIDSLYPIVKKYNKAIFQMTIRSVKSFGILYPSKEVFLSDMLRHLKKENDYVKGRTPFNCHVYIQGKKTMVGSWINDVQRALDWKYVISNDELTTFYRGMKMDEVLLKTGAWRKD